VLQKLHGLSDRDTAEAVRCDLRWKVACGLSLTDNGFHPTTLLYWRRRLAASGRPNRIFDAVAEVIAATGVLSGKTRRALDSTVPLLGDPLASAEYSPGITLPEPDSEAIIAERARELPVVDDIGWSLAQATAWRDGIPALAHTLATATAEATGVNTGELEILRERADEAYDGLIRHYPLIDPTQVGDCLLLLAAERYVAADEVMANYHYSWFEALDS
jgi:hypothetical protein